MPNLETMLAVAFAGFVLSATPGPSMLYVLSRSISQSRSAGYASAIGLGLGGIVLAIASAFGLAALFRQFDWLMIAFRFLGSIYLVYLGVSLIRGAYTTLDLTVADKPEMHQSFPQIMWQGVWVELLNPKTVLFFALFLPPFVDASLTGAELQLHLMVLGSLIPLTAFPADIIVAWMGASLSRTLAAKSDIRKFLAWIGGSVLVLIAVNLHLGLL